MRDMSPYLQREGGEADGANVKKHFICNLRKGQISYSDCPCQAFPALSNVIR